MITSEQLDLLDRISALNSRISVIAAALEGGLGHPRVQSGLHRLTCEISDELDTISDDIENILRAEAPDDR